MIRFQPASPVIGRHLWRPRQAAIQPGAGRLPFPGHRGPRDGQYLRHFLFGHAREVAELDNLSLTSVDEGQLSKRLFQEQNLAVALLPSADVFVERQPDRRARPFGGLALARVIDQDAPHHLRRQAEEVRPILPVDAILAGESDVGLVDERGRLQRVVWPFAAQMALARRRNSP